MIKLMDHVVEPQFTAVYQLLNIKGKVLKTY